MARFLVALTLLSGLLLDTPCIRGEPPVVFVSRELPEAPDTERREAAIERASSGRLLVLESGRVRSLVDARDPEVGPGTILDVMDPDVSFDASRIVFSGYSSEEGAWRLFEIGANGSGLRQITRSDRAIDLARYGDAASLFERYDDVDPCYLPDGRICFVSTRYPGAAPDGRVRATNLYVVNPDGTDLHRITTERFGADTPTVEPATGRIVYSRWWRSGQLNVDTGLESSPEPVPPGSPDYGTVARGTSAVTTPPAVRGVAPEDFPGVNSWFLAGIDPDGANLAMHSGFRVDREATQAYRPSFLPGGDVLALFIPETPLLGYPGPNGLRSFRKGAGRPEPLGGRNTFGREFVQFFYASAVALSDGRALVAASRRSADFDLFIYEAATDGDAPEGLEPLFGMEGTAELDAVPLTARPVPPVIPDRLTDRLRDEAPRTVEEAFEEGGRFTFTVENIFAGGPVDFAIADAPPAGKQLAIEFYMNPQRVSPSIADRPLLIERVEIPSSGKVEVELPGGVPLFEVLRLPNDDLPLGREGQIFHVAGMNFGRAGEQARCIGCHAGHTLLEVPDDPSWANLAPSAEITASSMLGRLRETEATAFQPGNLVDRSTEPRVGEWAARREGASVKLEWSARVRAREVIVYGTTPGPGLLGPTEQTIEGFHVTTFLGGEVQQTLDGPRALASGTALELDPSREFDRLVVTISPEDVRGTYEGQSAPALAEIVVTGQLTGEPRGSFVRGDADCDGTVNLSDAMLALGHLFGSGTTLCCEAAADADGNAAVNLTDGVYLLGFLFSATAAPPSPFPRCAPGTVDGLACDQEVCPPDGSVPIRPRR